MIISTTLTLVILFNVHLAQAVLNDTRCGSYYYVTGFETLESITNNSTGMIDQIVYFNNLTRNSSLTPHTGLCIPATIVNSLNICPSNAVPYTLKKGETTTSIFSTQPPLDNWVVGTLFGANKWMSPRMYGEGYLVCVPKANFTMFNLTNTRCVYYTVKAGETLTSIAGGNVDLINEMIIMNGFPTSTPTLAANSTICLPYSRHNYVVTPPCGANYYVPRANDTVQSLSGNNATLVDALLTANNWTAPVNNWTTAAYNWTTAAYNWTTAAYNWTTAANNWTTAAYNWTTAAYNWTTAANNWTTAANNWTTAAYNWTTAANNWTTAANNWTTAAYNWTTAANNWTTAANNWTTAAYNWTTAANNWTTAAYNWTTAAYNWTAPAPALIPGKS
jgi:hypothetical protein